MRRLVCVLTVSVLGCARSRATRNREALDPPVQVADLQFSEAGEATQSARWWTALDSPELNTLVDHSLAHNLTLRAAYARLSAANARVVQAGAPRFPRLAAEADVETAPSGPLQAEVGAGLTYELDLWGRIRAETDGAVRRRDATAADAQAAALSLSGEVARAWVDLTSAQAQLALLDDQLRANEGMSEVVYARFTNGVVREADALRQERLLVQTRSQRLRQQSELEVLEHQLALLLGRSPTETVRVATHTLPPLPPLPAVGVPTELLRRRPDVRAAELRLEALDSDVAVAIADQYPRLSLSAGVSTSGTSAGDLLSGWAVSLGANLLAPLFEAGARRAAVRGARADVEAGVAEYGNTLLVAIQEVEDALTRDRLQGDQVHNLTTQVRLAERTAKGLEAQYTGGLDVGYLDVLTAQTTAQQLRRDLIEAHRLHLEVRIDLYLSLAGDIPAGDPP